MCDPGMAMHACNPRGFRVPTLFGIESEIQSQANKGKKCLEYQMSILFVSDDSDHK